VTVGKEGITFKPRQVRLVRCCVIDKCNVTSAFVRTSSCYKLRTIQCALCDQFSATTKRVYLNKGTSFGNNDATCVLMALFAQSPYSQQGWGL